MLAVAAPVEDNWRTTWLDIIPHCPLTP